MIMKMTQHRRSTWLVGLLAASVLMMPLTALSQTKISLHKNKYSVSDDVKLGRQAAAEAEQQFPLLNDAQVSDYVERVGKKLVAAIPAEFQHREFRFFFKVVNARDINAFALPGGPMYVNRGMIEAARNEGEMAGVMAHELSHVALRHGTAQLTKAQNPSILAGIGAIGGAILGGPLGSIVSAGSQLGAGAYLLRYSREYETEADLLGARIMASAGYDPRDLANMFRTIEAQSGGGGGGFLSDHPSPKDRYARINQEAQYLTVSARNVDTREFYGIKERLRGYPGAPSMAEIQRTGGRYPNQGNRYPNGDPTGDPTNLPGGRVEYPSTRYRSYSEFGVVRLNVPDNWQEISQQDSVWFAPRGGFGSANGQSVFTHGMEVGVAKARSRNLQQATNDFINGLQQSNGNLSSRSGYQRATVDGRNAVSISFSNTNEATGRTEVVSLVTTQLRSGDLLYLISVVPEADYNTYASAFQTILRSIQLSD